ncbi:hypothetical protein NDU88_006680 [Pleurodeles waltl]|uniref:Uncharacterized protein n=1 Tax=Pleurodeles waltl TaxID=8319 RepID=A0AAV7TXW6_PLEWA|nr:hypothetical protein NDU88_006680 [Pleurodeles waltl]
MSKYRSDTLWGRVYPKNSPRQLRGYCDSKWRPQQSSEPVAAAARGQEDTRISWSTKRNISEYSVVQRPRATIQAQSLNSAIKKKRLGPVTMVKPKKQDKSPAGDSSHTENPPPNPTRESQTGHEQRETTLDTVLLAIKDSREALERKIDNLTADLSPRKLCGCRNPKWQPQQNSELAAAAALG